MDKTDWNLLIKKVANGLSGKEEEEFQHWLKQNKENENKYNEMVQLYQLSGDSLEDYHSNEIESWQALKEEIQKVPPKGKFSLHIKVFAMAASIAAILVLGIFFYQQERKEVNTTIQKELAFNSKKVIFDSDIEYATEQSSSQFYLPDSSLIHLNSNSILCVQKEGYFDSREVTLMGEAFFEVQSDSLVPFIVNMEDTRIVVLGTSFNVKTHTDHNSIEVVVTEGKIQFIAPDTSVVLTKDEQLAYNKVDKRTEPVIQHEYENNDLHWLIKDDLVVLKKETKKLINRLRNKRAHKKRKE